MDAQSMHERLEAHMEREETFQRDVAASLQDTAIALAKVVVRLDTNDKTLERLLAGVERMDERIDGHETRLREIERSVSQAATIAKWFFGGGFVAACASAYFLFKLVTILGSILKEMPK